jgi:2-dehydropantoate 2-reductase
MKIAVVGAGSIGGFVAARLAGAGEELTVIARRANLEAIRRDGLRLRNADGAEQVIHELRATHSFAEAGGQDVVILAMKANQVEAVVDELHHLLHANTVIVPMQNGIPWWYFQRLPPPQPNQYPIEAADAPLAAASLEGRIVRSVDPEGRIMRAIDPQRILGCVVYPACDMVAPGWVRHIEGDRFPLGELDGSETERVKQVSEAFVRGGFKAPVLSDVRGEIWLKLWGNLTFNPISALTHSTLVDICQYPLSRELAAAMMREAEAVAGRLGIRFRVSLERRIAGAEKVGKHKTSMLQDVESGRDPEIDALVGAVIELGEATGVPTPHINAVYALVKLLSQRIRNDGLAVRAQLAG